MRPPVPDEPCPPAPERRPDSRTLVRDEIERGRQCLRERVYGRAARYFHAAAWTAARAGFAAEHLDAQLKLADALLHSRQFEAALAAYRFARRLAEAASPDSSTTWLIRACGAQALRRTGRLADARKEAAAVSARIAGGAFPDVEKDPSLIARIARNLTAQIEAQEGRFDAAAGLALELAAAFDEAGDDARAGLEYANASLWTLFAAAACGARWPELHARASALRRAALLRLQQSAISGCDEKVMEVELQGVLELLIAARVVARENPSATGAPPVAELELLLDRASAAIDALVSGCGGNLQPQLRLAELLFRLRIAERRNPEQVNDLRRQLTELVAANRPLAREWIEQDLGARFSWAEIIPLSLRDRELEKLLGLETQS